MRSVIIAVCWGRERGGEVVFRAGGALSGAFVLGRSELGELAERGADRRE